jgi:hypothetical protein
LIEASFGIPYFTGVTIGDQEVWAVLLDFGALPNATTKMLTIPAEITSVWGGSGNYWIDTAQSFAHDSEIDVTVPLPYTTLLGGTPDLPKWNKNDVYVEGNMVSHKGNAYEANWYTVDVKPDKNSDQYEAWTDLGPLDEADVPLKGGETEVIELYIDSGMVVVRTTTNRLSFEAVIAINYIQAPN